MKTAKLFRNGQSQAVRLPKEFRFKGNKILIKKIGNAVILFSIRDPWESLVNSLDKFSSDFMESREQPPQQEREDIFE
jgi:antitoxin VapB